MTLETLDTFLEKLADTEGPWELVTINTVQLAIRRGCHCPLTAVADNCASAGDFIVAANKLGLSDIDRQKIVDSADGYEGSYDSLFDPALRARLLAATVKRTAQQD